MFILKEIEISFMATQYMRPYNHFFCKLYFVAWIARNASESHHKKHRYFKHETQIHWTVVVLKEVN